MNQKINDVRVLELLGRGMNNTQIARALGCDEASVRRAKNRLDWKEHLLPVDLEDRFAFNLDQPIVIANQDVMVTADWHIPVYNPYLVNEMIERARALEIRTLIIGGDLFNFDALSAYDPKQEEAGLEREVEETVNVLRTVEKSFDRIIYIWGNHDARMHRALGYKVRFAAAMRWLLGDLGSEILGKFEISNLDHCYIEFGDAHRDIRRWRVCHPASYSRIPLSTPRTLATKFNSNVICAHAHHAAIGHAIDGLRTVVEIGGLFDQAKTAYLQRTTTFPNWTPGYGWFKEGRFYLTTPAWETAY